MIIGSRQIGKTYIIEEFCRNEFKNYIEINLQKSPKIVEIFEQKKDPEEKLLRNTYLNGVKFENKNETNQIKINGNKNIRHIMWADINPYQKSPLELNNSENDLFFQKNIKPVTVHQSLRPRKGCIKGINNNNGINMNYNLNNNVKNMEISMENNFANLIKKFL